MSIILVPSQGISATNAPMSVGWPLRYRVQNATAAAGKTQISCLVRVRVGPLLVAGEFEVSPLFGATSPQATYEVNIQQVCSDWFKRFGFQVLLPHFNPANNVLYTRDEFYFADFTTEFRFIERDNATGAISQRLEVFSDTISVVFNTPQYEQALDLRPYLLQSPPQTAGVPSNNFARLVKLRRTDAQFLSYLRRNTRNNVCIEYLHRAPNGTRTQVGIIPVPDPIFAEFLISQFTVSVGLPSLAVATYLTGSYTAPPAGFGYSIRMVQGTTAPFLPLSFFTDFELQEPCDSTVRVWWLSMRGGIDSYNFTAKTEEQVVSKSETAQRPLLWNAAGNPRSTFFGQRFKSEIEADYQVLVESEPMTTEELKQIQDLLYSTAVYALLPSEASPVPVIISDSPIITNSYQDANKQIISFTLRFANPRLNLMP